MPHKPRPASAGVAYGARHHASGLGGLQRDAMSALLSSAFDASEALFQALCNCKAVVSSEAAEQTMPCR
eukprot:1958741-Prymnesium_polylepis.1